MKRIIALLLSVLILSALTTSVMADDSVTDITTVEELAALDGQSGTYRLCADIDLGGTDWKPISFYGTLSGNDHVLYNLKSDLTGTEHQSTIDGNDKVYDTVFSGLFSVLNGARISDLTILGEDISVTTDSSCFIGGLTGYIKDTTLENITLSDVRLTLNAGGINVGVGGIAGFGSGTIRGCSADVTLTFVDDNSMDVKCEEFMGGALANGNAILENDEISIQGYDSCHGYVHNGGMVGMFYQYDKNEDIGWIDQCNVNGQISFFEENDDRRAYCRDFIGESLTLIYEQNSTSDFVRNETFDYSVQLSPESCESPSYVDTVTDHTCTEWGYTEHYCSVCGYTYRDNFTAPDHRPGELTVVRAPDYETEGLQAVYCTECGTELYEESIPCLVKVNSISVPSSLSLNYKDSAQLKCEISPEDAVNKEVTWSTSDPAVISVDSNGNVIAEGKGSAVITCSSADGYASAETNVTVSFTAVQWLLYYICFGWIWY